MSDSTNLTLQNLVPGSFGSVTYCIEDASGKQAKLTVPPLGSVQYPTDPNSGPWQIYATINSLGTSGSSLSSAPSSYSDPNATVPSSLNISLSPAPVPNATPASTPVSGASPDTAGFTPLPQPSLLDASQGWKSLGDVLTPDVLPPSLQLNFTVQRQTQDQWCWAALAASIAAYYEPASTATQCLLANWAFGQTTCCIDGSTPSCNQPSSPGGAIDHLHCLFGATGRIGFGDVRNQIVASKPIGIRILWSEGSASVGHALSIYGYGAGNQPADQTTIDISDPWYGESVVNFQNFPANYHAGEAWTHTYLTKAPS
jgi:hypothetical protein